MPKMCNILKTAEFRTKRKIWASRSSEVCIRRVLCMSDSSSSDWGHLVHFENFPMLRFLKGYSTSTVFIQFQPNFMESTGIGGIQAFTFLAICQM